MPKFLNQNQVDQYYEEGFLSPIDVMSEDEALSYKNRLQDAEFTFPQALNAENRNNPHLAFKFLDELAHHPVVLDAVEDLIGSNISLWGSVLFIKEPTSPHFVSWHQDATYMGIEPHEFVTPWIALSPSNLESGCMSMIPGSHRKKIQKHEETFAKDNILTRGQSINGVDESLAVDLILRPGQMSLHHAEIIHGSQPNLSQQRRIGYALQAFMPPPARQTIGANYWLPIRGEDWHDDSPRLTRPLADMDAGGVANRKLANENWANILYQGAEQKRAY
jgi:hypothetical protein